MKISLRLALLALLVVALLGARFALAATLGGASSTRVGADNAAVTGCDTAFTETYTTSGGNVTSVSIAGIADPTCEGGALSVTLTDSSGVSIASGGPVTIPTDGDALDNTVNVSVSPQPAAENVANLNISITGP